MLGIKKESLWTITTTTSATKYIDKNIETD